MTKTLVSTAASVALLAMTIPRQTRAAIVLLLARDAVESTKSFPWFLSVVCIVAALWPLANKS